MKKTPTLKSSIINSLLLSIFGILLIVQSEATIVTISYIIGGVLVGLGAIAILRFFKNDDIIGTKLDIIYGVVCVIMGILVIRSPQAIASIIPFIIGIIIVINSATKLQYSLELRREESELWLSTLLLSIVMTICGVVLIFNPFKGAVFITRIVGIFILIYAILDLISTLVIRNTFIKLHDALVEPIKDAEIVEDGTEEENKEMPKKKVNKKKKTKKSSDKKEGKE